MQRVLIFMISNQEQYIGLWQPQHDTPWQQVTIEPGARADGQIFLALDSLLTAHNIPLRSITHLGVMPGPASYTQLRIYVATANSLAWALQLPLFPIPAQSVLPKDLPSLLAAAKRNVPIEPQYPTVIN